MKGLVRTTAAATVSLAALLAAGAASASSFSIRSGQGAEGLGMAYAGAAAGGVGMSSMAWNPATITMFPGRTSQWNFTYLLPQGEYKPTTGTRVMTSPVTSVPNTVLGGSPLGTGPIGGDGAFIPASYSAWQLTDRFWIGLTTGAPFGMRSKADNTFHAAQTYGRSAKVRSINVSPTIGYQVNDWLSIGAALQVQYFKADLKQATGLRATAGNAILDGDTVDFGYRFGVNLTPWQGTNIGIAYRSSIRQTLEGTLAGTPGLPPVLPVKANLNLPDSVVFGVSQVINEQWQAHLGVEWTNWSRFRRIPIVSRISGQPLSSLNFVYDDSWYFAAGVEYKYNPDLTLRAGVGYELSAVNDTNRTIYISDNDRLWLSAGMSYKFSEKINLDLGYTYIHINKARVNYNPAHPQFSPAAPVIYSAEAKPQVHVLSAALTYRWDNPAETIPVQPVVRKY
ncbi:OmpP1/FadL family transporter [Bosea sp. (in: a-proteobacteria)]|uniref:OmpP1/FadL family transporter n=1 Tax=Bosea sp. (in: a-proteobacteria) TaxID=1871050 RepID=UPI00260E1725|nr:outer membrane protein transport protein [Bosea sp. (in: a-proteobacteria)]MCO5092903.1 outer membrane protein transport protein [Bosea sp. (in: a-proteobacteria)]